MVKRKCGYSVGELWNHREDRAMISLLRLIDWLDTRLEEFIDGERTTGRNEKQTAANVEETVSAAKRVMAILIRNRRLIVSEEKKHYRVPGLLEILLAEKNHVDGALHSARTTLTRLEARLLEARMREKLAAAHNDAISQVRTWTKNRDLSR
jgi:hypothetical protein